MARARNIKPGFFANEDLAECSPWARLCFAGLWTLADREGRLEDRPKRIKGELFRFDTVDVEPLLQELVRFKFIIRYEIEGARYIAIPEFGAHQAPHYSEKESVIMPPPTLESGTHTPGVDPPSRGGRNPLIPDSLIPDSLIPDPGTQGAPPAGDTAGKPEASISPGAAVCIALRKRGIASVNPGHPKLLALVAAGATIDEFVGAIPAAKEKRDQFAYILGVVEGQRTDAAAMANGLHKGRLPNKQEALEDRNRSIAAAWAAKGGAP